MKPNKKNKKKIKEYYDFSSNDILEIKDLIQILTKAKSKTKTYDATFQNNIIIKEFFLQMAPKQEDSFYLNHPLFLQNVRRGNSIIEILGTGETKSERFICRKGLMKFFDLKLNYLQKQYKKSFLTKEDVLIKDLIFSDLLLALKQNKQIIVFKTSKENGLNSQISYISKCDAWLIASKNTSILIKEEKDIFAYDDSEFHLVKIIAQEWLKVLKSMTEEQIQKLKNDINNCTLIGELTGIDKFTSKLLKYSCQGLKFITIVDNFSQNTCILPSKALEFFTKFGIQTVKTEILCEAHTVDYLFDELIELHQEISKSSLEKSGEGVVLYFVIKDDLNPTEDRVASLCKIKTLEYRIFRKIREKLKNIRNNDKFPKNLFKIFQKESRMLCDSCEVELDVEYYDSVAEEFFDQIVKFYTKANFRRSINQFSEILPKVIYNVKNKIKRNVFEDFVKEIILLITPPHYINEPLKAFIEGEFSKTHKILKNFDSLKKNLQEDKKVGKYLFLLNCFEDFNLNEITEKILFVFLGFEEDTFKRINEKFPNVSLKELMDLKETLETNLKPFKNFTKIIFDNIDTNEVIKELKISFDAFQKQESFEKSENLKEIKNEKSCSSEEEEEEEEEEKNKN